jgi:hypothetical protein
VGRYLGRAQVGDQTPHSIGTVISSGLAQTSWGELELPQLLQCAFAHAAADCLVQLSAVTC